MADNNDYAITGLTVRETPQLSAGGKTALVTTVTFSVGSHGPFTLVYNGEKTNAARIAQDVGAKVNELRALTQALANFNAQQPR